MPVGGANVSQIAARRQGFTLVEVMIVVAIIALLAAVAIPSVLRGRATASEAKAVGDLRALVNSLEMYLAVNQVYPNQWGQQMYGLPCGTGAAPEPDFGPHAFCANLNAGAAIGGGYSYRYEPGSVPVSTYAMTAIPQTSGVTGGRSFQVTESGTIRHCSGTAIGGKSDWNTEATLDQVPSSC